MLSPLGGFSYHCFNCHFAARWEPGSYFTKKNVDLFQYLGIDDNTIMKCKLSCLGLDHVEGIQSKNTKIYDLPKESKTIVSLLEEDYQRTSFMQVVNYIMDRNPDYFNWETLYWSKEHPNGFIIPVTMNGKIVGYNVRFIKGKQKYISQVNKSVFYNHDLLYGERKFCIVMEGIFDAMSLSGLGILSNAMTDEQIHHLQGSDKDIIIYPDRDDAGKMLMDIALDNNWKVTFPTWDCKDADEAVRKYGQIPSLQHVISNVYDTPFKIRMAAKKYFQG